MGGRGRHIADAIAVRYRIMYAAARRRDVRGSSNKACNENFRIADNYLSPRRGKGGAQWRGEARGGGVGAVIGPGSVTYAAELHTKKIPKLLEF